MESLDSRVSGPQQRTSRTRRVMLIAVLVLASAGVLVAAFPLIVLLGPVASGRTIIVPSASLHEIPDRFHPHFGPNAAGISGEYSSVTRQCTFTYACTQSDFEAFIEREKLPAANQVTLDNRTIQTGRQWGPGIVSYEFFPDSNKATVAASAW